MSTSAIERAVAGGHLHRRYRGVYAIGRRDLPLAGERRAVVLACGDGAVLSHRSAAGAWGLRPDGASAWDVTVRTTTRRAPHTSIKVRRHRLTDEEVTLLDGFAVTTAARTLLDLAEAIPRHQLRRAVERADQLGLFDLREVERVLALHPRRCGRRNLVELLADARRHDLPLTRSDLEAALLELCLSQGLPRPEVNRYDNGKEVDFRWPAQRLVVEVDGWSSHRGRAAFERDRARDRELLRAGWRVARFTWRGVLDAPAGVARELAALLAAPTRVG